jgi:hypothetical protein
LFYFLHISEKNNSDLSGRETGIRSSGVPPVLRLRYVLLRKTLEDDPLEKIFWISLVLFLRRVSYGGHQKKEYPIVKRLS